MTITHTQAPTTTTDQPATTHGPRVELGRYQADTGTRRLVGQRIDGIVHVFDEPLTPGQPSFVVETRLDTNSELQALIADYLQTAQRLGYCPMHGWY